MSRITTPSRRSARCLALLCVCGLSLAAPRAPSNTRASQSQYAIQVSLSIPKPVWLEGEWPFLVVEYKNVTDQPVAAVLTGAVAHFTNAETGEYAGRDEPPCAIPTPQDPRPQPQAVTTLQPQAAVQVQLPMYNYGHGRWRVYLEMVRSPGAVAPGDPWPFEGYRSNEIVYQVVAVDMSRLTVLAEFPRPETDYPPYTIATYADFPGALYYASWRSYGPDQWALYRLQQIASDADPSTLQAKWEKESGLSILYRHLSDPGVWTYDQPPGRAPLYPAEFVVGPDDPLPILRPYAMPHAHERTYWAPYFKGYVYAIIPATPLTGPSCAWITEEEALNPE